MLSATEALASIIKDFKAMKANELHEAGLSTNRPWIVASKEKIKRDAPEHTPVEGDAPETFASLTEQTLHNVARVIKARRVEMDQGKRPWDPPLDAPALIARRKGALQEVNVPPIEVAFLYGYSSEKAAKELRIRHGLDENTGRLLQSNQRPPNRIGRKAR